MADNENTELNKTLQSNEFNYKVSDKDFWAILKENGGLFSKTADAIEQTLKVSYTRQAVKARAELQPEMLQAIRESIIDLAEDGLVTLMKSENERIKLDSCKYYTSTIGKNRGFTEKKEVELSGEISQITVIRETEVKSDGN